MTILEKIILMVITYNLIVLTGLYAVYAYLACDDFISLIACIVVVLLFGTLGLIEEE